MVSWFIAFRYIFSRVTTFAALLVVATSVALLIVIVSVMEGFRSELLARIRGTSADLKVESVRYIDLKDPDSVAAIVEAVPGVRATAPYVETMTLFRAGDSVRGAEDFQERYLRVIDVEREIRVGDLAKYIEAVGIPVLPKDAKTLFSRDWNERGIWQELRVRPARERPEALPPVVVGKEGARRDLLYPGDVIELTAFSPTAQRPRTGRFQVAGYFKTGIYDLDLNGILMERSVGKRFLGLEAPDGRELASGIAVGVEPGIEDEASLQRLRARIDEALDASGVPFVRTRTWREEKSSLINAVRVEKSLVSMILGMIVLFGGFMIFTVLTLLVVEKTRDIGVLRSMGATSGGVARIYLAIGLVLCISGTILGAAYGVGFAASVNTIQRWAKLLVGLEVFSQRVYYLERIPVRFDSADLVSIIVPTVVVSLLASIVPAYRAARKEPVAALRCE